MKCLYCGNADLVLENCPIGDRVQWTCPLCHADFWPEPIAEITRLRAIVEPLEALLKRSSDGVIIRRRNAGADVIEYMVDPDDGEYWDDTLPEALAAAAAAERSETDG
jgi:hypothetical protein